jgi:hypothetical protein
VREIAAKIDEGLRDQSRAAGHERASSPMLMAKFQEVNGTVSRASAGKTPSLWMDLWIQGAPRQTTSVSFEIADLGFRDRKWTVRRRKRASRQVREFLTDEMNSYGDVEIWAYGNLPRSENWSTSSTLYEALVRYYRDHLTSSEIKRGLSQIRKN